MESDESYEDGVYEASDVRARKRVTISPRAGGRKRQRTAGGSVEGAAPCRALSGRTGQSSVLGSPSTLLVVVLAARRSALRGARNVRVARAQAMSAWTRSRDDAPRLSVLVCLGPPCAVRWCRWQFFLSLSLIAHSVI